MFSKYICSYLKQKKIFFFRKSIIKKNKGGGGGDLVGEKRTFLGRQKFLGDGVTGGAKNLAGWKQIVGLAGILKDFKFESKTKKLCYTKVGKFEIFEKHGCPPPLWNERSRKEHLYLGCDLKIQKSQKWSKF